MDEIARNILATFDQLERASLDLHTLFEFVGGNRPERRTAVLDGVGGLVKAGLLRDDGADFYSRTEDGRVAVAPWRTITLYTRAGCRLCEEAKSAMAPLLSEFGATLREIDIDGDPILRDRYTNDVPVIFLGPQFFAEHHVDAERLRSALERAAPDSAGR
jgi:glutaredoxin